MRPLAALAVVTLLAASVARAEDPAVTGDLAAIRVPSPACRSIENAKDAERIRQQRDAQALMAFMLGHAGECRVLVKGARVHVMELAVWQGMARVRAEGSPDSYWMDHGFIEKVSSK